MDYERELAKQKISSREKLLQVGAKALREGQNVVVIGPFGIGKTHYCSSLASSIGLKALRISVVDDSRNMCIALLKKWCEDALEKETGKRKRSEIYNLWRGLHGLRFPQLKNQIQRIENKADYLVIVDDVLKIPRQKLLFIGFLADSGFRIVTAVEARCEESLLMDIRVKCRSAIRVFLPRLTAKESRAVILNMSRSLGLSLSETDVAWYATLYRGYPIMIVEGLKYKVSPKRVP